MELDKEQLCKQPALETEGLHFLHVTASPCLVPMAGTSPAEGVQLHPSLCGVSETFHPAEGLEAEATGLLWNLMLSLKDKRLEQLLV